MTLKPRQVSNLKSGIKAADIAIDPESTTEKMDIKTLFRQTGPIELEVGSGKGTFLLNQARLHPEINYLGIEYAGKYYRFSIDRMARWGMTNVRIIRTDAKEFIRCCLPDASIWTYHVYFPDPWPKKRHHKRRFFQPDNILQVARTLKPDGELRVATDHADYYQWICEIMLRHEKIVPLFEQIEFSAVESADDGEWVGSNFERKYIREGRQRYSLALKRKPPELADSSM